MTASPKPTLDPSTFLNLPTRVLPLDRIKPYWRNPRRVPEEAVDALVESMTLYGYQQPIVVDAEDVIVVGHTRYAALRKMGVTEVLVVEVNLPPEKAKQYRLIDNRTAELTSWDYNALILELREFDEGLLTTFFPDISLEADQIDQVTRVTAEEVAAAEEKVHSLPGWDPVESVEIVCPQCFHSFEIRRDSIASMLDRPEPEPGQIETLDLTGQ